MQNLMKYSTTIDRKLSKKLMPVKNFEEANAYENFPVMQEFFFLS